MFLAVYLRAGSAYGPQGTITGSILARAGMGRRHDKHVCRQSGNFEGFEWQVAMRVRQRRPYRYDYSRLLRVNLFLRPRYFCGHLLTDADLTLEQRYMLEKDRLRNRELHGKGIVCGLRISCDTNCCGHVVIGDGYAIDDCGNDLYFVRLTPLIIGALPTAGTAQVDCNDPGKRNDDCPMRQCFYIAACYYEDESDYETPFVTGCGSTPGTCEPTRVNERIRFQLLEELPEKKAYLEQVEARMRECSAPFTTGRFVEVINGYYNTFQNQESTGNFDRFCQLCALFLQQLKRRPSLQNCSLEAEVRALQCPKDNTTSNRAGEAAAFEKLLTLIHQYVYDCMLAQLAFECKNPCTPCCVVLGTVEVEDGKIVRVCNCEREYVWSFANFVEVLLYTILQGGACHQPAASLTTRDQAEASRVPTDECCPGFTVDSSQFAALYQLDPRVREYAGQTFMTAIRTAKESLQQSYQFTAQVLCRRNCLKRSRSRALQHWFQRWG